MILSRRSLMRGAAAALATASRPVAAALPHPPGGRLGLELYSVRNELKRDLAGALKTAHDWGFADVELAGLPPLTAAETARALKAAGLRAASAFVDYERLRDDFRGVVADARTLGLEYLICGWIPHEKTLTRQDVDRAIADFDKWAVAAVRENLRFGYHIHGYEFVATPEGTLLDTLVTRTDPERVDYEMDIFWVVRGGGDPVALLAAYAGRVRLVHLKDIRRGTPTGIPTGEAPDEASVALGTGMIDWPAVLKAAVAARVKWYFIEDEHPDAVKQIPQSIDYLRRVF
jgi:sugar phosphate isomerase/epimerase